MTRQVLKIAEKAAAFIERQVKEDLSGPVKLADIADYCQISPWHLQRQFKSTLGVTPKEYADALREKILRASLQKNRKVASSVYEAGFGSSSRVYERAARTLGMTPASYAKGGKGADIAFTVTRCPLGQMLVAATIKGLCRVQLGDDEQGLITRLEQEFPNAEKIEKNDKALKPYVEELLRRLKGKIPHRDLPTDIRATAFQKKVWAALIAIPLGQTETYSSVAKKIGVPNASRAVGTACGANPVPIAIPCHRVIREDGTLGGYAWGLPRKRQLLAIERIPDGKEVRDLLS